MLAVVQTYLVECRTIEQNIYIMKNEFFEIEATKPFSESSIWQLNKDYYQREGINAWQKETVPHNLTSNSQVGKTYAEIILGLLRDLSFQMKTTEVVYILELGTGHGRLAYHILKHLEKLTASLNINLPPYCYIVSDIAEDSLSFYLEHPQFQTFFEQGVLDLWYFDATADTELNLRYAKRKINKHSLNQPLLVISNYFFDSIPSDLFRIQDDSISACSISLHSDTPPKNIDKKDLLGQLELMFHQKEMKEPFYENGTYNEILENYRKQLVNSYLFFPKESFQCLNNLRTLSKKGALVISMDKGFQEMEELENKNAPELIRHGSFSVWVNYHAFGQYCEKSGGKYLFPAYSTFYSQVVCLLLLPDFEDYKETAASYQNHVNRFGPDDFNGLKRLAYTNIARLTLKDLLAVIRLSHYDSTLFIKVLPRIKQVLHYITVPERKRLSQAMAQVWDMYFSIKEPYDLAYEIGGIFYDLGFYRKALLYFGHSTDLFGKNADVYYNRALCHFQLREDNKFIEIRKATRRLFPSHAGNAHLDKLDLNSA